MDCNYVQGYYYAKPMTEEDFRALIQKSVIDKEMLKPACFIPTNKVNIIKNTGNSKIMLLVDDVKLNRTILAEYFKKDYTIVEADNGLAALKYLRKHASEVTIVLLDLIMPIMNGFEVMAKMKASKKLKNIPVIATSQTGGKMEVKAFKLGADDFISKPYDKNVCCKRVENVIALSKIIK